MGIFVRLFGAIKESLIESIIDINQRKDSKSSAKNHRPADHPGSNDTKKVIETVLSGIFSSTDLSTPYYCDFIKSEDDADRLKNKLPLIYVWNENKQLGSFSLTVNGSMIGKIVERFIDRSHPDFKIARDEILSKISMVSNSSVKSICQLSGNLPSVLFSKSNREKLIAEMNESI